MRRRPTLAVAIATLAAATPQPRVYGFTSPGLGVGLQSGLSNQQMSLLGFVLMHHNSYPISLPSLRWRATWVNDNQYISHEDLWDLGPWNAAAARGELPRLVHDAPTHEISFRRTWQRHEFYISGLRKNDLSAQVDPSTEIKERNPKDIALMRAFVPSARLRQRAARVAAELDLGEAYGCLHTRIETDMHRVGNMEQAMERNNLTSFARIAASLRARDEFPGAARKVFVAVDAAHVVPSEREAMLQPAWPGVAFAVDLKPRNGTLLENAIVDGYICSRATWFVGWPGSTFTNQITLARSIFNKTSFFYNNRGVFPRTDDGRRVRERFSHDNQGAQRLADLRDRTRTW